MQIIMPVLFVLFLYMFYTKNNALQNQYAQIEKEMNALNALNQVVVDKFDITQGELLEKENKIKKIKVNTTAFNGTACANCHLREENLLPINNHYVRVDDFVNIVRKGHDKAPAYTNTGSKGRFDITDSEVKRQFRIIQELYPEDFKTKKRK